MRLLLRLLLPLALLLGPVAAFGQVLEASAPMDCCAPGECPCPVPMPTAPRAPQAPMAPVVRVAPVQVAQQDKAPRGPEPRPWAPSLRPAASLRMKATPAPVPFDPDPPDANVRQSLLSTFRK